MVPRGVDLHQWGVSESPWLRGELHIAGKGTVMRLYCAQPLVGWGSDPRNQGLGAKAVRTRVAEAGVKVLFPKAGQLSGLPARVTSQSVIYYFN